MEISALWDPSPWLGNGFRGAVHKMRTRKEPAGLASQRSSVGSPEAKASGICDTVEKGRKVHRELW